MNKRLSALILALALMFAQVVPVQAVPLEAEAVEVSAESAPAELLEASTEGEDDDETPVDDVESVEAPVDDGESVEEAADSEDDDEAPVDDGESVEEAADSENDDETPVDGGESAETLGDSNTLTAVTLPLHRINENPLDVTVWYANGDKTIPYVPVSLLETICPNIGFHMSGNTLTSDIAPGSVTFDAQNDKFTQHAFALTSDDNDDHTFPVAHTIDKTRSEGHDVTVDMAKSGYRIFEKDNQILFPVTALSAFFMEPMYVMLDCDGERLYSVSYYSVIGSGSEGAAYQQQILPLMMAEPWKEWTPAMRNANYQAVCLRLDWVYGLRGRWPNGIDEYLKQNYAWLREALLTEESASNVYVLQVMLRYMVDDLHTDIMGYPTFMMADPSIQPNLSNELMGQMQSLAASSHFQSFRKKMQAYTAQRAAALTIDSPYHVRYYKDMAVLTWNSFNTNLDFWDNYKVGDPITSQDTPGFLYRTFADIQANHPEVTKIVLDLSLNTGGSYSSVLTTMGFMKRQFSMVWNYGITDVQLTTYYSLDTNLDNKIDNSDSLEGKYEFYILVSGASFSAANELAYFAKRAGAATIIGETTGGGAAAIAASMDFYGLPYSYSSTTSYGIDETHLNDVFVEPDIPLSNDVWYDDAKLQAALPDVYTVTITDGTLGDGNTSGKFHAGDTVTVTAREHPDGNSFREWKWTSVLPIVLSDETVSTTSFVMPGGSVQVSATYHPPAQGCYIATSVYGSYDCPEV